MRYRELKCHWRGRFGAVRCGVGVSVFRVLRVLPLAGVVRVGSVRCLFVVYTAKKRENLAEIPFKLKNLTFNL